MNNLCNAQYLIPHISKLVSLLDVKSRNKGMCILFWPFYMYKRDSNEGEGEMMSESFYTSRKKILAFLPFFFFLQLAIQILFMLSAV